MSKNPFKNMATRIKADGTVSIVGIVSQDDWLDLPIPDRFISLSCSYIEAAIQRFKAIKDSLENAQYADALVGAYLFQHSLELFLKAMLIKKGTRIFNTHKISLLLTAYHKHFPEPSYRFTGKISDLAAFDSKINSSQFVRFPVDTSGNPWVMDFHFDIDLWVEQLGCFKKDYLRIKELAVESCRGK